MTLSEPQLQQPVVENESDVEDKRHSGVAVAEQDDIPDPPPVTRTGRAIRAPERYGF